MTDSQEEAYRDVSKPRKVQCRTKWKMFQNALNWINLRNAQDKGLAFWQTRSNAVILHDSVPADCLEILKEWWIPKLKRFCIRKFDYLRKRLTRSTHLLKGSKKIIHNLGNVQYFERCEISSKTQCSDRSKYWADGAVYCTCGSCPIPTENTRLLQKRNANRGAWHGKTDDQREYHQAKVSLRKAHSKIFKSILERFQKQDTYRESQVAIGWTEDTCSHLDQIANEDNPYIATWSERQRYENNRKLALNAQRRLLRSCPGNKRFASERQTWRLLSDFTAPSDPSKTISRKAMEMEYLVHTIFVRVGMDKIANVLDLSKVGGLQINYFSNKEFRSQEMAIPL